MKKKIKIIILFTILRCKAKERYKVIYIDMNHHRKQLIIFDEH